MSISLERFASKYELTIQEAEAALVRIVQMHGVKVKLSHKDGVVWFLGHCEEPQTRASGLAAQLESSFESLCKLQQANTQILGSTDFLRATAQSSSGGCEVVV